MNEHDRTVLRKLAEEKARIAALPVQRERIRAWTRLNSLKPVRPMLWIDEIPWNETGIDDQLECEDSFCRELEGQLRRTLYKWEYAQGDMVVEDCLYCPLVYHETGFGMEERGEKRIPEAGAIASRAFEAQITCEDDIEKIRMPEVSLDIDATEEYLDRMNRIFAGVLPVALRGRAGIWFAPWDQLVTWWGVEEAMLDLVQRPELVHAAMRRLLDAHIGLLRQYEKLNLLSLNNTTIRVGSGGYGCTTELPAKGYDQFQVHARDQWGFATAQIFSEVSPAMHEEFALRYEIEWLENFGLNYYGCCEPLHNKIDILRAIPRLRKISVSPWADIRKSAEAIGTDCVLSWKPNPAHLADAQWDPDFIRRYIRGALRKMRGCAVEIILKDISTIHHDPRRLHEWAAIAREEVDAFRSN